MCNTFIHHRISIFNIQVFYLPPCHLVSTQICLWNKVCTELHLCWTRADLSGRYVSFTSLPPQCEQIFSALTGLETPWGRRQGSRNGARSNGKWLVWQEMDPPTQNTHHTPTRRLHLARGLVHQYGWMWWEEEVGVEGWIWVWDISDIHSVQIEQSGIGAEVRNSSVQGRNNEGTKKKHQSIKWIVKHQFIFSSSVEERTLRQHLMCSRGH